MADVLPLVSRHRGTDRERLVQRSTACSSPPAPRARSAAIAGSLGDNLLVRAADVCLKERRRLVLLFRETPLHLGHIELMANVTRFGAIVMPPVPAFYTHPVTVEEIATQTAARALEVLGVAVPALKRWPARGELNHG